MESIDQREKLDLTNKQQFDILMELFSLNMRTINFWLASCVFPGEMQQYPQRMTATAWNIADGGDLGVVGFSGTNDNHRYVFTWWNFGIATRYVLSLSHPISDPLKEFTTSCQSVFPHR